VASKTGCRDGENAFIQRPGFLLVVDDEPVGAAVGFDEFVQTPEGSFIGPLGIFDFDWQESEIALEDEIDLRSTACSVVMGLVRDA